EIPQDDEGWIEPGEVSDAFLEHQAPVQVFYGLQVVAASKVNAAELVVGLAKTGDIVLLAPNLERFVEVPRGAKVVPALEVNTSQIVEGAHQRLLETQLLEGIQGALVVVHGMRIVAFSIEGIGHDPVKLAELRQIADFLANADALQA